MDGRGSEKAAKLYEGRELQVLTFLIAILGYSAE
jgi:hypothetical protein